MDTDKLDGLLKRLTAVGVRGLTSQPPTLEELFLRHYSGDDAVDEAGSDPGAPAESGRAANPSGARA